MWADPITYSSHFEVFLRRSSSFFNFHLFNSIQSKIVLRHADGNAQPCISNHSIQGFVWELSILLISPFLSAYRMNIVFCFAGLPHLRKFNSCGDVTDWFSVFNFCGSQLAGKIFQHFPCGRCVIQGAMNIFNINIQPLAMDCRLFELKIENILLSNF